jgi:hypothetical protein
MHPLLPLLCLWERSAAVDHHHQQQQQKGLLLRVLLFLQGSWLCSLF